MLASYMINTIAAREGLRTQLIELDYVLSWILLIIPEILGINRHWIMKGGTALRKVYFSDWRYSEDLDFTITYEYKAEEIEDCLSELAKILMDRSGIRLKIKETDALKTFNVGKSIKIPLSYVGPLLKTAHPRSFSLDLTFDELITTPPKRVPLKTNYPDQINMRASILVYSLNEILSEKIRSILQRREPRDLYDIWRLFKEHSYELELIELPQNFLNKCLHRGLKEVSLKDMFNDRAMKVLERQWDVRLKHQMINLPPFEKVARETKRLIREHLMID